MVADLRKVAAHLNQPGPERLQMALPLRQNAQAIAGIGKRGARVGAGMRAALLFEQRDGNGEIVLHAVRKFAEQNVLVALDLARALERRAQRVGKHRERKADAEERDQRAGLGGLWVEPADCDQGRGSRDHRRINARHPVEGERTNENASEQQEHARQRR